MQLRLAYAHDASHYLMVPDSVSAVSSVEEVSRLLAMRSANEQPLTFRSGGTSLSGQAQSDALLVDTRRGFRGIEVLDQGRRVRVGPGATIRQVNARLASSGFKLGPDPASEVACTIGGVVANNSSGMVCGTEFNTYRTIESLIVVLASGTVVDTGSGDADYQLRVAEPALYEGLMRLRDRVRGNPESMRVITRQFAMKNTMGYAVNALADFTYPVDILVHLMVGSEGTLGFIAEATFRTVPIRPHVATGFLVFDTIEDATGALPELVASGLAAIELMDATSLRVSQRDPMSGGALPAMTVDGHAGLLIEYQEMTSDALAARREVAEGMLQHIRLTVPARLSSTPAARGDLWHLRKGLYATVAGNRPSGTTALLEDVAVPVASLAHTCQSLLAMFDQYGYDESVIFGHAKDGNIHFLLNERFDRPELLSRFTAFTEALVDLVLGAGGTLKAEHGTGRMMAPFVRRQYGDELYDVMREIKALFDPAGILNPGVIISDDPQIHVTNLKTTPTVEAEVDRCVECGYCEPVCPSKDLTLTPRQRIVLRRERQRAADAGDIALVRDLDQAAEYSVVDTCAADGMCQTACPVLIDTGALVKRLRAARHTPIQEVVWGAASRHWAGTTAVAARALDVAARMPRTAGAATVVTRAVAGVDTVPSWDRSLPRGGPPRVPRRENPPEAVYVPSCVNTMFGPEPGGSGVQAAFVALCERAGVAVSIPSGIASMCCGTPWKSKGMTRGYRQMQDRVVPWLWTATDHGRLPVVTDASSCTEGLVSILDDAQRTHGTRITVLDAIQFTADTLLPRLGRADRLPSLALHPTCSTTRLGLNEALLSVARAVAVDVTIPDDWGCCAFAGDRGLLHPELTASATQVQADWIRQRSFTAHASSNRTCEIGMTRATGHPYRHLLELLAESLTHPDTPPHPDTSPHPGKEPTT